VGGRVCLSILTCLALTQASPKPVVAQDQTDPHALLQEADRLAWMKAWTKAGPLFAEARRQFEARGDRRNALYAEINQLRVQLPRLAVPDVSQRLEAYLDDPLVQSDDLLHLRCLVIKGETDEDFDPTLANASWREALTIAERIGDAGWANRAHGEIGVVAFQLGDVNTSIVELGRAMNVARTTGDGPSLVRWLTLFGTGYMQLGQTTQALDFYDQALKAAGSIPGLQFPVMTYVGKTDALAKLNRFAEAEELLQASLVVAEREGALGYQAELAMEQGEIDLSLGQPDSALTRLLRAADLARQSGGNRLLAEIELEIAALQERLRHPSEADASLQEGIAAARRQGERFLLPRLLARRAGLRTTQGGYAEARQTLDEASDLLEGLLTKVASPWVRSRVIDGMNSVYAARLRLEAADERDPRRAFAVVERARGRSLLELMLATPVAAVPRTSDVRAREQEVAALQLKLLRTTNRGDRQGLLDQIFVAESRLSVVSTELFMRTRNAPRQPVGLSALQRVLKSDEVFVEFALADPTSFAIVATHNGARIQRLSARTAIERDVEALLKVVRAGQSSDAEAKRISTLLLEGVPELASHSRLVVSPDGDLHQVPFELLVGASGQPLLRTHVVSYVPSGSILAILRERASSMLPPQIALAVSAWSPTDGSGSAPPTTPAARGVYDLDLTKLAPLPSADDEARAAGTLLDATKSTVLLGAAATELAVKRAPLQDYDVLHFAVHGVLSRKVPSRSALVLRAAGGEDGLLQAGEILELRLRANLVTLSACDTGAGVVHGQDGVASLVRPFLAAGAHAVVANLWAADDQFSLSLMRAFYTRLAAGADVADALRDAKLAMIDRFGPQALPKLWSGVLAYGDTSRAVHAAHRIAN
jgi:CHAT domain-containing protein